MGNGLTYRVPPFQRDYSWSEEEWEDLWIDILGTVRDEGEPAHYMGYLVLQSNDEKTFDIIDGQQRLTTLSIIALAVLKNLSRLIDRNIEADNNRQRLDQIRQTYVGYLDPVTLVPRSKLTLNRNNDNYFQTYLIPLVPSLPQRGFRASEHSLRKAFEWFDRKLEDYLRTVDQDPGVALATFIENMSDRLFFTVITVTDELNAYKVFETLNARGVRLSATDLLKNYLFSVLHKSGTHEHDLRTLENRWEAIVGRLGAESFPDFLRVHWNSRRPQAGLPVRQTDLFKTIRSQLRDRAQVFELLRQMDEDLDPYLALTTPEGSSWSDDLKTQVAFLKMFSVRQPFALLLAARRSLDDQDFLKLLASCVVISFRYNVIGGLASGEQERIYHLATRTIVNDALHDASRIIPLLESIYPSDEAFRGAFASKSIRTTQSRNRRIVRYMLCKLERHLHGNGFDFESDTLSIEHILPENADAGWETFPEQDSDSYVYRIGNMTLLETQKNRDLGASAYARKREVYSGSSFGITLDIATEYDDWTPAAIDRRQAYLARQAVAVWRIAQIAGR